MLPIRMLLASNSGESDLIRPSTACLDAEYRDARGMLAHDARKCFNWRSLHEEVCMIYLPMDPKRTSALGESWIRLSFK
jgi:hypothetical protein